MDRQRRVIAWGRRNPQLVNAAVVLFFVVGSSISAAVIEPTGSERPTDWIAYVLIVAAAATAWWRRTHPLIALPFATAFVTAYWIADYVGSFDPVLWFLFFGATRHASNRRHARIVVGACLASLIGVAIAGVISPGEGLPLSAVFGLAISHGAAAAIGEAMYHRSLYVAELEQRAAMLEADLEHKAALAAVDERTRIAREMHDIIAHGMSTVVVQAQAGQSVVDTQPDRARQVLATIEQIGRDSVDEMRRMLGVLRNNDGELELEPQPSFGDFNTLRQSAEDAGVPVEITTSGDARILPPGLELTGYRVVQEALTNVIRHGGSAASANVDIHYGDASLDISINDNGLGAAASSTTAGSGHGLLGMRERVEIYSGTFNAGPRSGGGYSVNVSLPVPARATA